MYLGLIDSYTMRNTLFLGLFMKGAYQFYLQPHGETARIRHRNCIDNVHNIEEFIV